MKPQDYPDVFNCDLVTAEHWNYAEHCNVVQYADDTLVLSGDKYLLAINENLDKSFISLAQYFDQISLNLNSEKREYITLCSLYKNRMTKSLMNNFEGQI